MLGILICELLREQPLPHTRQAQGPAGGQCDSGWSRHRLGERHGTDRSGPFQDGPLAFGLDPYL